MAWLGEGLSSLKGQITNFTKEVLSEVAEAKEDGCGHELQLLDAEEKIQRLENLCTVKDLEISKLRERNAALETQTSQFQLQSKKQQPLLYHVGSSPNLGGSFTFGDPGNAKREVAFDFSSMEAEKDDLVDYLRAEIRALKIEKEKVEKKMEAFQTKCSCSEVDTESTDNKTSVKDRVSPNGVNTSELVYSKIQKPENSLDRLEDNSQNSTPFQEKKNQSGEPQSFDGETNLSNFHMEKQPPIHFNNMKNLDGSEPQYNLEKRMNVDDGISCVRNVPGIEPDGDKLMDARGECDGSEEIPKDVVKLMDQISKLTVSLSDAQLNVNQYQENEKEILREIERMKDQELMAKESFKNLTTQFENAQKCNFQLEQKLEELDKQNTATIDQLMSMVSSVKKENEVLQAELKELEGKCLSLELELQSCSLNSKTMQREIELEMEKEVLKFIPPELIPREQRSTNGCSGVVVGAVKGLAKALEEHRWKKDAIERKLSEVMKEAREVKAECLLLRSEISRRDNSSGLRTEGLAPILETGEEEDEDEEMSGDSLPKDSQQPSDDKTCQGNDSCDGIEPNWQKRCLILEEELKRMKTEHTSEQKNPDLFDEDDEDDADGTEEVNDWTWQAANGEKVFEAKNIDLVHNLFVKDGEHVITTISNDVEISPLPSTLESSRSEKCDVPTLTEQYIKEKSKLESIISELHEEKSTLETEQENSRKALLKLEEKILGLTEDLDAKSKVAMNMLDEEKRLKGVLSEFESKIDSLEKLLAARDSNVKELETEITSLNSILLNERRSGDEMKTSIMKLKDQVSSLEIKLKNKEDSLTENVKEIIILEERQKFLEQNLEEEVKMKGEQSQLVAYLEGKVASLQADFDQEFELKVKALRELEELKEKNKDLDNKVAYEIQLKEEALNKLTDVEERFHIVEKSVHQEMISKNEYSDRIVDLERRLNAAEEEAKLDKSLKDEALIRVSEQEVHLKGLENELALEKRILQEKEQCILDNLEKIKALEMERERIMCVVGDKAREISSLRSERQRLVEAMSSMEKMRQQEMVNDSNLGMGISGPGNSHKDSSSPEGTDSQPGERDAVELEDDGTIKLLAKIKNLQLESEQLAESYRQEQQRNKHLQNEVHEMLEKETALQDELQRLRMHLVSVEDRYTKEAVNAEERIAFLKNKLTQVEERLHASSSAYTSASVRSNQQVESLENQIRALTEKKDESKNRLMAAEELLAQQAKDLTNLQTVLEQFQKDKDREISIVKDKMGMEISSLENKCYELSEEIMSLKEQLNQAKEGLNAAARLSEQSDKKSEMIASLKTELKKLNASVISTEERLQNASLSVEGKVDKNLVKNLLLGYLSSPMQGPRRNEIIRIIATILEFTKEEKEKVDILDGPGKGSGWLRGLAGWGGNQHRDGNPTSDLNQPSLSEAFIRFLENESRPKSVPQLHMISETRIEPVQSSSPALGHSRTPSASSTPPLLMSEAILPTLPTFPVASGSNSSCILKDVLKDS